MTYQYNIPTNSIKIKITGTVQGVGFRPFIYCLAKELDIKGYVCNDGSGVLIHAYSDNPERISEFIEQIKLRKPVNSTINNIEIIQDNQNDHSEQYNSFEIIHSHNDSCSPSVLVPDLALCDDCKRELKNPTDRRYNYPFINCINCGPRFSIVNSLPYDREHTVMIQFPMCKDCEEEYSNPTNRRFHAQAIACPKCGPKIWIYDATHNYEAINNQVIKNTKDVIDYAIFCINRGDIIAIKGLGGFHICVNPFINDSVNLLRYKKLRPYKPFALMARDLETIEKYCYLSNTEREILNSGESPILILKARLNPSINLLSSVSPNINSLGVMLPYTPLHRLLFDHPDCPPLLIMTSGNRKDMPIEKDNDSGIKSLKDFANLFILHNRDISNRLDDSIVKVIRDKKTIIRRSRGYVPKAFPLKWDLPNIIAVGAELKNTFCFIKDNSAIMAQHIGDLKSAVTFDFYKNLIDFYIRLMDFKPDLIVSDLHPHYLSTVYAQELSKQFNVPIKKVQHHHAHALSVMAEFGLDESLAIVLDGVGLGEDMTIWGGEILLARRDGFKRLGHLSHLRMPGGDIASKEPWRMALSALYEIYGEDIPKSCISNIVKEADKIPIIINMLKNNFNSPLTSSCGRLFDAVSSLLNVCHYNTYEAQAAMELESLAEESDLSINGFYVDMNKFLFDFHDDKIVLNTREIIKNILKFVELGYEKSYIARYFHYLIVYCLCEILKLICKKNNLSIRNIVLSGGSMQNSILLDGFITKLSEMGYNVYIPEKFPMNDGGISLGQAIAV